MEKITPLGNTLQNETIHSQVKETNTSAVHVIINYTNNWRKQTGTIHWLITSPANKTPLTQIARPTSPSEWTAVATREALLLKLDCRHKFKLLPSKYNGRARPLPWRHFIHTANTSLLCKRPLEQYKEVIFRAKVGVAHGFRRCCTSSAERKGQHLLSHHLS